MRKPVSVIEAENAPISPSAATVSWRQILTPKYAISLSLVCLGVWLNAADRLIVSTMLPAILADIGGEAYISWVFVLYDVGAIVSGAVSALLTLRLGLRWPMAWAALTFAAGCALAAIADGMEWVLVGRLLQGVGGGGLLSLAFIAVGLLFPRHLAARALASLSALWGVSAFLGPLIGGLYVEYGSWRGGFWFFAIQAALLCVWVVSRREPASPDPAAAKGAFPVARLAVLSAGIVAVMTAGVAPDWTRTPVLLLAGLAALWLFLRMDGAVAENRMLPRHPIDLRKPIGSAIVMVFCLSAATVAFPMLGAVFMTSLYQTPPLVAGYLIACLPVAWSLMALAVSGRPETDDPKLIRAGLSLVAVGITGLIFSVPDGGVWLTGLCSLIQGAGFGMAWTSVLRRATALAPAGEKERVMGAISTVQRIGYAIGAAVIGLAANIAGLDAANPAVAAAAQAVFLVSLVIGLCGLAAVFRFANFNPTPAKM